MFILCTFGISSLGCWSYSLADSADLPEVKHWSWGRAIYKGEHQSHQHRRGGNSDSECLALGQWILWVGPLGSTKAMLNHHLYIDKLALVVSTSMVFQTFCYTLQFIYIYGKHLDVLDTASQYVLMFHYVLCISKCCFCYFSHNHMFVASSFQEETVIKFLSKVKLFQRLPKELEPVEKSRRIWRCFIGKRTPCTRCIWGWLSRVPSQGYHHFPYDCCFDVCFYSRM